MKAAIVRGPSLSKWEMQIYEPLAGKVALVGIGSQKSDHDLQEVAFPVVRLPCLGEYLSYVPRGISGLYQAFGDPQILIGFDHVVNGLDIVHSVELASYFSLQAVEAKQKGVVKAVTLTVYENVPFLGDENGARRKLKAKVIAGTDHFLAANEKAKEALLAEGVEAVRISVVGQGVDTGRFTPNPISQIPNSKLRRQWGIPDEDLVVLAVGRMVWEKGFYDLIRAAYKIKSQNPNPKFQNTVRFLLVGDGSERKKLEGMVQRLDLGETVVFSGRIPYSRMPTVFQSADLFVHSSLPTREWNEQFGGVLIEAMAAGLPIVGTLNGGIAQTVEAEEFHFSSGSFIGKGGIYVPPQDFSEISRAIELLAGDRKLRQQMGKRNRKRVERFDHQVIADNIYQIWRKVLAKSA